MAVEVTAAIPALPRNGQRGVPQRQATGDRLQEEMALPRDASATPSGSAIRRHSRARIPARDAGRRRSAPAGHSSLVRARGAAGARGAVAVCDSPSPCAAQTGGCVVRPRRVAFRRRPAHASSPGAARPVGRPPGGGDVVVIDADAMRASTADSLADLRCAAKPACSCRAAAAQNGQASGVFRGANAGQTAVWSTACASARPRWGLPALETLSLAPQVERIEVLRGPGSSLYGADAVGGVVHVQIHPRGRRRAALPTSHRGGGRLRQPPGLGRPAAASALRPVGHAGARVQRRRFRAPPERCLQQLQPRPRRLPARQRAGARGLPADGQRVGLAVSRNKLNAQYDASEFPPPTFAQDKRLTSATTASRRPWRWTGRHAGPGPHRQREGRAGLDDLESGGNVIDRFTTKRDQAGVQLAGRPASPAALGALETTDEKADTTSRFQPCAATAPRWSSSRATRKASAGRPTCGATTTPARRRDTGARRRLGFVPGGMRALAGNTFRAPSFNDLYPRLRRAHAAAPEKAQRRSWPVLAGRDGRRPAHGVPQPRARPHRLPGQCSPLPRRPGLCLRLRQQHRRARLTGATLGGSAKLMPSRLRAGVGRLPRRQGRRQRPAFAAPRRAPGEPGADWSRRDWSAGAALLGLRARRRCRIWPPRPR